MVLLRLVILKNSDFLLELWRTATFPLQTLKNSDLFPSNYEEQRPSIPFRTLKNRDLSPFELKNSDFPLWNSEKQRLSPFKLFPLRTLKNSYLFPSNSEEQWPFPFELWRTATFPFRTLKNRDLSPFELKNNDLPFSNSEKQRPSPVEHWTRLAATFSNFVCKAVAPQLHILY